MELVKTLWMNNIWPSILSGAITLVVVLIVMQLFSIRGSSLSSNLRFKLLELPVIKSFLVLLGLNLGGLKISWYTVLFIYSWGVICFVQRWISYEKFKTDVLLAGVCTRAVASVPTAPAHGAIAQHSTGKGSGPGHIEYRREKSR